MSDTLPVEQQNNPIDLSIYPKDEKGRYVIPDDVFVDTYKYLPNGCINESHSLISYNHGFMRTLQKNDPRSQEIRRMGAEALNAKNAQRRSFAESIDYWLKQKNQDKPELSNQDAIVAAMIKSANEGNTRAAEFLRDSVGEKPVEKTEAEITGATPAQMALINNVYNRLTDPASDQQTEEQEAAAGPQQIPKKESQEEGTE